MPFLSCLEQAMFGFGQKKPNTGTPPTRPGLFARLKRTRDQLGHGLAKLCQGHKQLDSELLEAIETQLLMADFGVEATTGITSELQQNMRQAGAKAKDVYSQLRGQLTEALLPYEATVPMDSASAPFSLLVVGINGAGKTTTLGKLAHHFVQTGRRVMMAAGDTYRAAAVAQLQSWGKRCKVPVIAQRQGADSAALIYDAMQAARAKGCDVLLADTAGRLHTQNHLMAELKKIKRVMRKADPNAPSATWLVLDAGIGQNALSQVAAFHEHLGLTGLVVTKLDGTAKGGVLWSLTERFGLPIYFVGTGEGMDDLIPFDAKAWVDAIFGDDAEKTP